MPAQQHTNEAFSRVRIDAQLKDVQCSLTNGRRVCFESPLLDGTRADYVLCDRYGRALAVVKAKPAALNPVEAKGQALAYAKQLSVPSLFLSNGQEIWFWEPDREALAEYIADIHALIDQQERQLAKADELMNALIARFFGNSAGLEVAA